MLTRKSATTGLQSPSSLGSKHTSSDPAVADSLNCQDGMPKGLHVKTRYKLSSDSQASIATWEQASTPLHCPKCFLSWLVAVVCCSQYVLWASRMSASTPEAHEQGPDLHPHGNHMAHQQPPVKQELAEQAHQEGFISTADPSPAVLKTEFPPKLEPHLAPPSKAQQDTPDGEDGCRRRQGLAFLYCDSDDAASAGFCLLSALWGTVVQARFY